MYFRPFPLLTVFAVPALILLIALGVWQSQRAGWKAHEVELARERIDAPPMSIEAACAQGLTEQQIIVAPPASGETLRVFGPRASGKPGWRLFQVASLCGAPVLVQTGFEELQIGGPGGVSPAPAEAWPDRYIVAPWPEKPVLASDNAPERNEWLWMDAPAITSAIGQPTLNTRLVVLPLEGMPDFLVRTPPETHVGYAVTWFGMAIAFVVIYGLFHMRAGRLRFGSKTARGKAE